MYDVKARIFQMFLKDGCSYTICNGIVTVVTPDKEIWDFTTPVVKSIKSICLNCGSPVPENGECKHCPVDVERYTGVSKSED